MSLIRRFAPFAILVVALWWVVSHADLSLLAGGSLTDKVAVEAPTESQDRAAVALAKVRVAKLQTAPAANVDYRRSDFGPGWKTVRGCDMRNRALARDLVEERFKPGTRDCVVESGILVEDLYSGRRVEFVKGGPLANSLDIDHVVPLSYAAQHGAHGWSADRRESFANDPSNLLAVDAATNREKGDDGPSEWLPVASGRCVYVAAFVNVATEYRVTVTEADKSRIEKVLAGC